MAKYKITQEELGLFNKYFEVVDKKVNGYFIIRERESKRKIKMFKTLGASDKWIWRSIPALRVLDSGGDAK